MGKMERKKAKRGSNNMDNWNIGFLVGDEAAGVATGDGILNQVIEKTKHGRITLLDSGGRGQLYVCITVKVEETRSLKAGTKTLSLSLVEMQKPQTQTKDMLAADHSGHGNGVSAAVHIMQPGGTTIYEATTEH